MKIDMRCNVCGSYNEGLRQIRIIKYSNNTTDKIESIHCIECKTLRYSKQTKIGDGR